MGFTDFTEIDADSASGKRVGFRTATGFLESSTETADESVERTPGLAERARTRGWRVGVGEVRARRRVNLSFAELV